VPDSRLSVTVYGGAPGEIGGNRILLECADRRWLLDFGMGFGAVGRFFEEFVQPRGATLGLRDYLRMGLIPPLEGLYRSDLASLVSRWQEPGAGERRLLALARGHRMKRVLRRMLDPAEFLSDCGVRAMSRYHAEHPYMLELNGQTYRVAYEPAESRTGLFGGNSNWRGPVWFPINFLLIEALRRFHHYYGDDFLVEHPTGSGTYRTLSAIADDLSSRLTRIFLRDEHGRRPVFGGNERFQTDPNWRDYIPFHEYFHGDTGAGLGASHQTGWTALVATLLEQPRPGERGR
jgi:hypothetical protein